MGVDLFRNNSTNEATIDDGFVEHFNWTGWDLVLRTATQYGWEPEGTTLDTDPDWCGCYMTNDGQAISVQDAAAIHTALVASTNAGATDGDKEFFASAIAAFNTTTPLYIY